MKLISFKHNGIEYLNFDIEDKDTRLYLENEIGKEELQNILNDINSQPSIPTLEQRLQMAEETLLFLLGGM